MDYLFGYFKNSFFMQPLFEIQMTKVKSIWQFKTFETKCNTFWGLLLYNSIKVYSEIKTPKCLSLSLSFLSTKKKENTKMEKQQGRWQTSWAKTSPTPLLWSLLPRTDEGTTRMCCPWRRSLHVLPSSTCSLRSPS